MKQTIKHHLAFFMLVFIDNLIFIFPVCIFLCYLLNNPQIGDVLKEVAKNNLIACFIGMYVFMTAYFEFWYFEEKKVFPKLRRHMSIKNAIQLEKYKLPFILKVIIKLCMIFCIIATLSKLLFAVNFIYKDGIITSEMLIWSIIFTLACTIMNYIWYWLPPLIGYLIRNKLNIIYKE